MAWAAVPPRATSPASTLPPRPEPLRLFQIVRRGGRQQINRPASNPSREALMSGQIHRLCQMVFLLFSFLAMATEPAAGQTRVTIGVTEPFETNNPYGDSSGLLYGIWSEIT